MLTIRGVAKAYDGKPVLRGVDLDVARGEIICLLGASGSGKTTLLRIIAGLEAADRGNVCIDAVSVLTTPIHRRDFGLMFQDFALFPHLNVLDNAAFGLRMHRVPRDERERRAREALALVGLRGFERRDVTSLSGGERQRVALARSLAPNPRLLMLDEPLGSLDESLRERLVTDLHDIIKGIGLTALYVTHDQREAYAIADRIAIMHNGRFEQIAPPQSLYRQPATEYVARFLGLNNIIPIEQMENGKAHTALGSFAMDVPSAALLLHPDGLHLDSTGTISGVVRDIAFQGSSYRIEVEHASGHRLTFQAYGRACDELHPGASVTIAVKPDAIVGLSG